MPVIHKCYSHELAEKFGCAKPDARIQLKVAMKAIEDEEARMARLFASGKITESV
ncbi:MAG: hypothetical protein ABI970_26135 [Chloroflexota bacterium]